jgi:hypothetical protein
MRGLCFFHKILDRGFTWIIICYFQFRSKSAGRLCINHKMWSSSRHRSSCGIFDNRFCRTSHGEISGVAINLHRPALPAKKKTTLEALKENPAETIAPLAEITGKSTAAISRGIKKYQSAGLLRREGAKKTGSWVVLWGKCFLSNFDPPGFLHNRNPGPLCFRFCRYCPLCLVNASVSFVTAK